MPLHSNFGIQENSSEERVDEENKATFNKKNQFAVHCLGETVANPPYSSCPAFVGHKNEESSLSPSVQSLLSLPLNKESVMDKKQDDSINEDQVPEKKKRVKKD